MNEARRATRSPIAFFVHRLSGIALALFLPAHFYVLSLSLTNPALLDSFLAFTALPPVKAAETALVALLAVHLAFGVRLLVLELLPWRDPRNLRTMLVDGGIAFGALIAAAFFWVAL